MLEQWHAHQHAGLGSHGDLFAYAFQSPTAPFIGHESKALPPLKLLVLRQPAGIFPDPASPDYALQVALKVDAYAQFDLGAGRFGQHVRDGDAVLTPPGAASHVELAGPSELAVVLLPGQRTAELARSIDPRFGGDFGPVHASVLSAPELQRSVLRLVRAARDEPGCLVDPDAEHLTLVTLLSDAAARLRSRRFCMSPVARRRVIDFVEASLGEDLTLFRLAAVAELSPYHFARSFRRDVGLTPHLYVTVRRVNRAQRLLLESDKSLAEVALAAGFASQAHLTVVFRRFTGTTPGHYRTTLRSLRGGA